MSNVCTAPPILSIGKPVICARRTANEIKSALVNISVTSRQSSMLYLASSALLFWYRVLISSTLSFAEIVLPRPSSCCPTFSSEKLSKDQKAARSMSIPSSTDRPGTLAIFTGLAPLPTCKMTDASPPRPSASERLYSSHLRAIKSRSKPTTFHPISTSGSTCCNNAKKPSSKSFSVLKNRSSKSSQTVLSLSALPASGVLSSTIRTTLILPLCRAIE